MGLNFGVAYVRGAADANPHHKKPGQYGDSEMETGPEYDWQTERDTKYYIRGFSRWFNTATDAPLDK